MVMVSSMFACGILLFSKAILKVGKSNYAKEILLIVLRYTVNIPMRLVWINLFVEQRSV